MFTNFPFDCASVQSVTLLHTREYANVNLELFVLGPLKHILPDVHIAQKICLLKQLQLLLRVGDLITFGYVPSTDFHTHYSSTLFINFPSIVAVTDFLYDTPDHYEKQEFFFPS